MKINLPLAIVLLFFVPFNTMGGWVITSRYIDSGGNVIPKRYFFENSQVRVETHDFIYSCNLETGSIIMVDAENLVYTRTSLESYTDKMKEIKLKRLDQVLALVPDDQKALYEKKYKQQVETDLVLPQCNTDSLTVTFFPDTIKVLNLYAQRFTVELKGQLKEEFLFSKQVKLPAGFDQGTFLKFIYQLEPEDKTVCYQASPKYLNAVKDGLVVGRIIIDDGLRSEWQIIKIEKRAIPDYEFGIPALCKELTLDKWLTRNKQADDKYYDDYE